MKPETLLNSDGLASRARAHWTPDRLQRLMAGKRLPLHPVTHAVFLQATGSMGAASQLDLPKSCWRSHDGWVE